MLARVLLKSVYSTERFAVLTKNNTLYKSPVFQQTQSWQRALPLRSFSTDSFRPIKGNQLTSGKCIEMDGKAFIVMSSNHVKPGKGVAFSQVELREVVSGTRRHERARASDTYSEIVLSKPDSFQVLYTEDDAVVLMNMETFDQVEVHASIIGEAKLPFLTEGSTVKVHFFKGQPLTVDMPTMAELKVASTDGVSNVVLENGVTIRAPAYLQVGDTIRVKIEDRSFEQRLQKSGE